MFLQAARRVISKQRNVAIAHRTLRTTAKRKNNVLNQILEGDSGKGILSTKMYHYTVYGSVALFPVALVLSPSVINIPVDVALGFVFPIHAHIGMNYVISDYVPKGLRPAARTGWLAVTAITVLQLSLIICGTESTNRTEIVWQWTMDPTHICSSEIHVMIKIFPSWPFWMRNSDPPWNSASTWCSRSWSGDSW